MPSDLKSSLVTLALLFLLAGCANRTVVESSAVDSFGTDEAELDFWDDLAERSVVTNGDAIHGLLLLAGENMTADRFETAGERGWIDTDADLNPNESATIGMIAVAICDILQINGGLTMQLFGRSPRYCTRELIFMEMMPARTDRQSLSGLEFIELISRAEDRLPAVTDTNAATAPQESTS